MSYGKSQQQATLSYSTVANKKEFEQVVAR